MWSFNVAEWDLVTYLRRHNHIASHESSISKVCDNEPRCLIDITHTPHITQSHCHTVIGDVKWRWSVVKIVHVESDDHWLSRTHSIEILRKVDLISKRLGASRMKIQKETCSSSAGRFSLKFRTPYPCRARRWSLAGWHSPSLAWSASPGSRG